MSDGADTIVIVEDKVRLRRTLWSTLSTHGFAIETGTIADAERVITEHRPAAILLHLGVPDGDGLDLLRRLREWSAVPVIIISARDRERDKVNALDAGADDYVTKPFAPNELLARIRVAIRRTRNQAAPANEPILEVGAIRVDRSRHLVTLAGNPIHLTPTEFRLLVVLSRDVDNVITHNQLMTEVWGRGPSDLRHLRVHMSALRRKLEANPARPRWLLTEPGIGYRICRPEEAT